MEAFRRYIPKSALEALQAEVAERDGTPRSARITPPHWEYDAYGFSLYFVT